LWDEVKDILDHSAMTLSGGQQQRLCIARALAMKPDILLMDEPTSALDPISTAKIEELIDELKKQYTIIIVTHNMQQAARVSEHTGFFYIGKLIEFNTTEKIFTNPDVKQTEEYITGGSVKKGESMEEKRHTSREYERELQEIKNGLLYLGAMTERAIDRSVKALLERDSDLARQVISDDNQIDKSMWKSRKNVSACWHCDSRLLAICVSLRRPSKSTATWNALGIWRPILLKKQLFSTRCRKSSPT